MLRYLVLLALVTNFHFSKSHKYSVAKFGAKRPILNLENLLQNCSALHRFAINSQRIFDIAETEDRTMQTL